VKSAASGAQIGWRATATTERAASVLEGDVLFVTGMLQGR
jgi:hypothetical protein